MENFQYITPPLRLFHGEDSLRQLGRELDRLGSSRAVIVCGRSLASHPSALAPVREALGARCVGTFDGVRAHSPVPTVQAAAEQLAAWQADAVVAVGGGSAIVTARAASILLAEGPDVRALCTRQGDDGRLISPRLSAPKLPQFVVPTTPTTAAAKAGSAVFDPSDSSRLALFDPKTRAHAVFVHPALIATAPDALVVSASLNTLTMAVEGLESPSANALSDADLMHALRLIRQRLGLGTNEPAARGDLIVAALLCARGTDTAGGGVASVLSHALGARFGLENGIANAILLPHTLRFNATAATARINAEKIVEALGQPGTAGPDAASAALEPLLARLALPGRLRDLGVPHDSLESIATHAMGDWFLQKNPRAVSRAAELTDLLDRAW